MRLDGIALVLALALGGVPPPEVAVLDVSRPDAVYEDVSRGLAEDAVAAFTRAGLTASRVDEDEAPPLPDATPGLDPDGACRSGPCLEAVARRSGARVLVLLGADEKAPDRVEVGLVALDAATGRPLVARRYRAGKEAARALRRFAQDLEKALRAMGPTGPPRPLPGQTPAPASPSRR